jgi:hypothetical protein
MSIGEIMLSIQIRLIDGFACPVVPAIFLSLSPSQMRV